MVEVVKKFVVIGIHTEPKGAYHELTDLVKVKDDAHKRWPDIDVPSLLLPFPSSPLPRFPTLP